MDPVKKNTFEQKTHHTYQKRQTTQPPQSTGLSSRPRSPSSVPVFQPSVPSPTGSLRKACSKAYAANRPPTRNAMHRASAGSFLQVSNPRRLLPASLSSTTRTPARRTGHIKFALRSFAWFKARPGHHLGSTGTGTESGDYPFKSNQI